MKIILSLFLLFAFVNNLFAEVTEKEYQKRITKLKIKLNTKEIPIEYTYRFFTSNFFKESNQKSLKYLNPKEIKKHVKREIKANKNKIKDVNILLLKEHLNQWKNIYDIAETKYKVNREVIAAILIKETHIGKLKLRYNSTNVFYSILKNIDGKNKREKSLIKMANDSLLTSVYYCYKKGLEPDKCSFKSSYAGALGIPQFMPFNLVYAVGYKNKIPNLNKMEDAILSVANYFVKVMKWNKLIDWNKTNGLNLLLEEWYLNKENVYRFSSKVDKYNTYLKNKKGNIVADYIKTFADKLYLYNNSSPYVVGVLEIAFKLNKRSN